MANKIEPQKDFLDIFRQKNSKLWDLNKDNSNKGED